jgi:hypothetical protein
MTIQDVHIDYATTDTTGSVTAGYLDLSGYLTPVHLMRIATETRHLWYKAVTRPALPTSAQKQSLLYLSVDLDIPSVDTGVESDPRLYYCMLVRTHMLDGSLYLSALLLESIDPDQGMFERIGIAQALSLEKEDLDGLLRELSQQTCLPCRSFDEGMCTIRVI